MDLKVYTKEEVKQPSGTEYVYTPNVIDIIPTIVEVTTQDDIRNNTWTLEKLKQIAEVRIENDKLIINSDKVTYQDGILYVTLTENQLVSADLVDGDGEIEQACALATIWQKGLDPLDLESGVRWSEVMLEEVDVVQLIDDITKAVSAVTPTVTVVFDIIVDKDGNQRLSYKLQAVG